MRTVGQRLHHVRTLAGLNQTELAELAGLKSTRHVGLIEEGERPNVTRQTAIGLCDVLGMSLDFFLLGKGPPPDKVDADAAVARARRRPGKARKAS